MIDYDNSTFREIWDYEYEEGLERRGVLSSSLSTGKFYDSDRDIIYYMKSGKIHREDGPSYIHKKHFSYYIWYNNGKVHRIEGPAVYVFYNNYIEKQFYIFNKNVSESDFLSFSNLVNGNEVILL
ncbi:MAG: hypothetical protein ACOCV1_03150 [Bacillota bacterium]